MPLRITRAAILTDVADPNFPPLNYTYTDNLLTDLGGDLTVMLQAWLQNYVPQKLEPLTNSERANERKVIKSDIDSTKIIIDTIKAALNRPRKDIEKSLLNRKLVAANKKLKKQNARMHNLLTKNKIVDDLVTKITIGQVNEINGAKYYLRTSTDAEVYQPDDIAIAVKEFINDLLQLNYYNLENLLANGSTPIVGFYANTPNNFLNKPIFQNLTRLDIFDCEYIAMYQGDNARKLKLRRDGDKKAWQNWCTVSHFSDEGGTFIWVPNAFPLILFDGTEGSTGYAWNKQRSRYERTNVGRKKLGCYLVTAEPPLINFFTPEIAGTRGSSGGGGAMRADRVTEVDYRWTGPSKLGMAIGLRAAQMVAPTDAGYVQSPIIGARSGLKTAVIGDMSSGIVYWRKFLDPVPTPPRNKKNLPSTTIPLTPVSYSKADDALCYRVSAFTKKKKGCWQLCIFGSAKPGETLNHGNSNDRLDAGTVMKEAFDTMGLAMDGSATQFAINRIAPATDAFASAEWIQLSASLSARDGQAIDLAAAKSSIRTSQEWCHLYGHGDGGNESVENFLSGSKHCNTEQLAIELAQRYGSQPGLSAKVTGYIFPNTPTLKVALLQTDRAFLFMLNSDVFKPMATDEELIAAGKAFFAPNPRKFEDMLPVASTAEVPSSNDYTKLGNTAQGQAAQAKIRKRLYDRLHDSIVIAWPLASVIRYKIYFNQTKIFDHFFWAQKESFDLNEFNILYWTVRRVIADATGSRASFDIEVDLKALRNNALNAAT